MDIKSLIDWGIRQSRRMTAFDQQLKLPAAVTATATPVVAATETPPAEQARWADTHQKFNARDPNLTMLPSTVFIELAMACNLGCEMCPVPKHMELMPGRAAAIMKPPVFEKIIRDLSDQKHELCLTQLGEPLLNKHIVSYVSSAKEAGHRVGFYSNGTLLTSKKSDDLLAAGLDYIVFSFDGATKETYESIRLNGNYENTIGYIKYFIEANARTGNKCSVEIHMIVSDLTDGEVKAFEAMWQGLAPTRLIPLDDWAGQIVLPAKFGKPRTPKQPKPRHACDLLWTALYVSAEGDVIYCCHDYKKDSKLSNVLDKSLAEIWHSQVQSERARHTKNDYSSGPCQHCEAWLTRPNHYG
jgi:radical SAM protein with 4Fe4S-binding SPASM domain